MLFKHPQFPKSFACQKHPRLPWDVLLVCLFGTTFAIDAASAAPSDRARERAVQAVNDVEAASGKLRTGQLIEKSPSAEELIAIGELHFRTHQYDAAIDKLNMVVELRSQGKASVGSDADAQYLLGESYFASGQLYSAQRHFEAVVERSDEPAYMRFGGPAASRLVDVALQIQRREALENVLEQVEKMLQKAMEESLLYARAKVLFALGRFQDARVQAEKVGGASLYSQRASYLRGTALMKEAQASLDPDDPGAVPDYTLAISAFEQAAVPTSHVREDAQKARQITDLSWLAVARLHYASQQFDQSATAYEKIPRSSASFSEALFEVSWTYVRLGQYQRAQRALEALAVLEPGLVDGADAELLRGDLLLRAGRFDEADTAYHAVRDKYEPLRNQVSAYLKKYVDPAVYYDKLTSADIEAGHELPLLAVDWAREAAEEDRVFAIVDDVARSRSLIKRSRRIITLLQAGLSSDSRAKVFPEVRRRMEDVLALINQLAIARLSLARGMDETAGSANAQLAPVRQKRRELMARLGQIPTSPGDFSVREARAEHSWNNVSQALQRLQLEADHLRALVNGLHQVVADARSHGVSADEPTLERYRQEIAENEKDLAVYFQRIDALRQQVEMGRVQSGFGDERFAEDARVRQEFSRVFEQETTLAAGGADPKATSYAASIQPVLSRIAVIEARLHGVKKQLDEQTMRKAEEMQAAIRIESEAMQIYASRLDTLDQHARVLVGEVARSNFIKAKDRIRDVVMRADVGLVQQAWELREEQRFRVRDLLRERAQEERFINDELREVLDDLEDQ